MLKTSGRGLNFNYYDLPMTNFSNWIGKENLQYSNNIICN